MKNDLTCAVVGDLLPAYAEGLTAPETNDAVERHLSACPDCAAKLAAMRAPEPEREPEETAKEVDYLKKVKRRSWKRVVLAVFLTLLSRHQLVQTIISALDEISHNEIPLSKNDGSSITFSHIQGIPAENVVGQYIPSGLPALVGSILLADTRVGLIPYFEKPLPAGIHVVLEQFHSVKTGKGQNRVFFVIGREAAVLRFRNGKFPV